MLSITLKMIIQGDPSAERFYLAAGGVKNGKRDSASVPGASFTTIYNLIGR